MGKGRDTTTLPSTDRKKDGLDCPYCGKIIGIGAVNPSNCLSQHTTKYCPKKKKKTRKRRALILSDSESGDDAPIAVHRPSPKRLTYRTVVVSSATQQQAQKQERLINEGSSIECTEWNSDVELDICTPTDHGVEESSESQSSAACSGRQHFDLSPGLTSVIRTSQSSREELLDKLMICTQKLQKKMDVIEAQEKQLVENKGRIDGLSQQIRERDLTIADLRMKLGCNVELGSDVDPLSGIQPLLDLH